MADSGTGPSTTQQSYDNKLDPAFTASRHDEQSVGSKNLKVNVLNLRHRAYHLHLDLNETRVPISNEDTNIGKRWLQELHDVAQELYHIYTNTEQLAGAIAKKPHRYSDAFTQDHQKNYEEMSQTFDEIEEVHQTLEKTIDDQDIPWSFRKGHVDRLIKRLSIIGTQLKIMNIVIHDVTREPTGDEKASPVTQSRNILEAAPTTNKETICDDNEQDEDRRIPTTFDEILNRVDASVNHPAAGTLSDIPGTQSAMSGPAAAAAAAGMGGRRRLSLRVKEKIRGSFVGKAAAGVRRRTVSLGGILGDKREEKQ